MFLDSWHINYFYFSSGTENYFRLWLKYFPMKVKCDHFLNWDEWQLIIKQMKHDKVPLKKRFIQTGPKCGIFSLKVQGFNLITFYKKSICLLRNILCQASRHKFQIFMIFHPKKYKSKLPINLIYTEVFLWIGVFSTRSMPLQNQ